MSGNSNKPGIPGTQAVSDKDYLALAGFVDAKDTGQRIKKTEPHGKALRTAGEMYRKRDYVAAYQRLKPVYDKVVSDMQRVLARNPDFEANKLAKEMRISLAAAKDNLQKMKAHAQQVIDQFDKLLRDLESKPIVRHYLKKGARPSVVAEPAAEESPPTMMASDDDTQVTSSPVVPQEIASGSRRYLKAPYAPPVQGAVYAVRDSSGADRVIRIVAVSADDKLVQVEKLKDGMPSKPVELSVDSLARQAAKGWCSLLMPIEDEAKPLEAPPARSGKPATSDSTVNVTMRLDSQNFGRCSADIVRADIKFSTQQIKDVGDGPFRAGNFEQAFLTFEQLAVSFNAAVANSRRTIADGRRALNSEKTNLSGKEVQDRTAAFVRSEQLIHTAEREFSTILEGLRMYLRASQDNAAT
jgi:hypothetical protein